jgi:hypothetical protein
MWSVFPSFRNILGGDVDPEKCVKAVAALGVFAIAAWVMFVAVELLSSDKEGSGWFHFRASYLQLAWALAVIICWAVAKRDSLAVVLLRSRLYPRPVPGVAAKSQAWTKSTPATSPDGVFRKDRRFWGNILSYEEVNALPPQRQAHRTGRKIQYKEVQVGLCSNLDADYQA